MLCDIIPIQEGKSKVKILGRYIIRLVFSKKAAYNYLRISLNYISSTYKSCNHNLICLERDYLEQ